MKPDNDNEEQMDIANDNDDLRKLRTRVVVGCPLLFVCCVV